MARQHRRSTAVSALKELHHAVIPVLCEIRPAYLIDNCIVSENDLRTLVEALKAINEELFALILGEQVFVAHRTLLNGLLRDFVGGVHRPHLIDFLTLMSADSSIVRPLEAVSKNLLKVLEEEEREAVIRFDTDFISLPTLAGLLLSYPALYYCDNPNAKLLDADVDVYSLRTDSADPQTLLQFSGPIPFRQVITKDLEKLAEEWNGKLSSLSPVLSQKWTEYTGAESSCTLKSYVETRRVSILTL